MTFLLKTVLNQSTTKNKINLSKVTFVDSIILANNINTIINNKVNYNVHYYNYNCIIIIIIIIIILINNILLVCFSQRLKQYFPAKYFPVIFVLFTILLLLDLIYFKWLD